MSKFIIPTAPHLNPVNLGLFSTSTPIDVDEAPLPRPRALGPLRIDMPVSSVHAEVLRRITPDSSPIPASAFLDVPPRYSSVPSVDSKSHQTELSLMSEHSGDGWKRSGLNIFRNDDRLTTGSKVSKHKLVFRLFPVNLLGITIEFTILDTCKGAGLAIVLIPEKNNVGKRLFQLQRFDNKTKVDVSALKQDPDVIMALNPKSQTLSPVSYEGLAGTEFEGCVITLYFGMTKIKGGRHKEVYGIKIEGNSPDGKSFLEKYQSPPLKIVGYDDDGIQVEWGSIQERIVDTGDAVNVASDSKLLVFRDYVNSNITIVGCDDTFCSIKRKPSSTPEFKVKYDTRYEKVAKLCENQWVFDVDLPEDEFAAEATGEDEEKEFSSQFRLIRKPQNWQVQLIQTEIESESKITSLNCESVYIESSQLHVLRISKIASKGSSGFCEYIAVKVLDSGEMIRRPLTHDEHRVLEMQSITEKYSQSGEVHYTPDNGLTFPAIPSPIGAYSDKVTSAIFDVDLAKEKVNLDYPYQVQILGLNPGYPEVPAKWLGGPFLNSVWQGQREVTSVGIDQDSRVICVKDEIEDAHYYVPVGEEEPRQYIYSNVKPERFDANKVTYLPRLLEKEDVALNLSSGNILITLPAADMEAESEYLQINGVFIQVENGVASFSFDRNANWESDAVESVALSASHSILKINDDVFLFPIIVENTVRIAIAPYPPDTSTKWIVLQKHEVSRVADAIEEPVITPAPPVPVPPIEMITTDHQALAPRGFAKIFDPSRGPAARTLHGLGDHYHKNSVNLQNNEMLASLEAEKLLNGREFDDGLLLSTGMLSNYRMIWSYPNRKGRISFVGKRISPFYAGSGLRFGGAAEKSPFVWSLDMHLTIVNGKPVPAHSEKYPVATLTYRFPDLANRHTTTTKTIVNSPIEDGKEYSQAEFISDDATELGWYLRFDNFAGTGKTVLAIPYIDLIKVGGNRSPMMGFYLTNTTSNKGMPEALRKSLARINKSLARDAGLSIARPDEKYFYPAVEEGPESVTIRFAAIEPTASSGHSDSRPHDEQRQLSSEDSGIAKYGESPDRTVTPDLPPVVQDVARAVEPSLPPVSAPSEERSLQSLAAGLYAGLPMDTPPMFRLQLGLWMMGYEPNREQKTLIDVIVENLGRDVNAEKFESLREILENYPKDVILALNRNALKNLLKLSAEDGRVMLPFFQAGHEDVTQVQQVISWFEGSMEERSTRALAFLNEHPGQIDVKAKNLAQSLGDINLYGLFAKLKAKHAAFFEKTLDVASWLEDLDNKTRILDCLKIYDGLSADAQSDLIGEWDDFIQSPSNREQGLGRFLRSFLRQHTK